VARLIQAISDTVIYKQKATLGGKTPKDERVKYFKLGFCLFTSLFSQWSHERQKTRDISAKNTQLNKIE